MLTAATLPLDPAFHTASSDTNWMEGCNQSTGWRAAINQLDGGLQSIKAVALASWVEA